jgi:RNA polymerase sigma factor for flagellar operon FliA
MSNLDNSKMTDEEFEIIHKQYKETGNISLRNKLVMNFAAIPKTAAMQLRGLTASYAQVEDMVNQGMITLIDCIDKFDFSKGIKFEAYAFMRVRGSIIDLVRKQDWVPRRVRMNSKEISSVYNSLCHELQREPTKEEIAEKMNISVNKLDHYNSEISNAVAFSFEELIQNMSQMGDVLESALSEDLTPEKKVIKTELREMLKKSIDVLSERERLVVTLYYYEELTLSEIAEVLNVSLQRVSQINSKAIMKLRSNMSDYINA